jgi:glycosyltransferase involved in cell wall biosynthesis
MFVYNDVVNDSRVLREARSLVDAGHTVTIVGRERGGEPGGTSSVDGLHLIRVPSPGPLARASSLLPERGRLQRRVAGRAREWLAAPPFGWLRVGGLAVACVALLPLAALAFVVLSVARTRIADWLFVDRIVRWRLGILAWNRAAASIGPVADVYHGHDLTALPAAAEAARRHHALLVYDSHEYFVESGRYGRRPAWAKAHLLSLERRLVGQVAALVTVNETLGRILGRRLRPPRVVVVHNCMPRWQPPDPAPDLLRRAAGIDPGAPVVLYHGRFLADRGLGQLASALLEPGLEQVHAVFLGFGPGEGHVRSLEADSRFGARIHRLRGVPPAELLEWIASADVAVMPNQPTSANERLSTPNKLFESLAAGVPVVSSDFPERRRIVIDDPGGPLGAVCDPTDPRSIAAAIRGILALDAGARAELRRRCLRAAHERWNWETESGRLLSLYDDLETARSTC